MSTPSKRKGTAFETAVAEYLRNVFGPRIVRRAPTGTNDCGDIAGLPSFAIQCKNHARMALAEWVDETERQRVNAGEPFAAVVHKRAGRNTGEAYVTMRLLDFAVLIDRARRHGAL